MPKIPLYNQGQGGRVQTAAGALSPRANVGAFTAPGQAQAAFAEKAGQVAFQFGMAEKEAQTQKAKRDITALVNQQMNDWTNKNQDTTVEGYQASAAAEKERLRLSALEGMRGSLTRRQFADVSGSFDSTFATKVAQGSQIAHTKNQAIRLESANSYLDNMRTELSTLNPDSDLYRTKMAEVEDQYTGFIASGLNPTLTLDGFKKGVDADNFNLGTDAAQTQAQLDVARAKNDARTDLSATEKLRREKSIVTKEAVVQQNLSDAIFNDIVRFDDEELTDKFVKQGIKELREGKLEYIYTNAQGEKVVTDFSSLKPGTRTALIARLEARKDSKDAEFNKTFIETTDARLQDMTLDELVAEKDILAKRQKGYGGLDQSIIDSVDSRINSEIAERKPKALALATQKQKNIVAEIARNGLLSKEGEAAAADVVATLNNAGLPSQALEFQKSLRVEGSATTQFKSIQFSSATKTKQAIATAKAAYNREPTDENLRILTRLQEKVELRNAEMAKDPVGYYNEQKPNSPLEPSEMIAMQLRMGTQPLDVRVTSNAQLNEFKAQFKGTDNYEEKSRIGVEFLTQFGENQNIVMRHLMSTGTIDLVDNLLMAYPDQAFMRDVVTYNSEEQVASYSKRIDNDDRKTIEEAVSKALGDYNGSILGIMADGITGANTNRGTASHALGVMKVVENTAKGYVLFNKKSPEEAAELAYENIIGRNYEFGTVNNSQVRFPSRTYANVEGMTDILNTSVVDNEQYLRSIIDPPPPPANADPSMIKALNDDFYMDLAEKGSWRTTTDNSGVYFVDGTGNIVPRTPESTVSVSGDMSADPMAGFVTVSFAKLSNMEEQVRAFNDPESDSYVRNPQLREKRVREFILGNQLF